MYSESNINKSSLLHALKVERLKNKQLQDQINDSSGSGGSGADVQDIKNGYLALKYILEWQNRQNIDEQINAAKTRTNESINAMIQTCDIISSQQIKEKILSYLNNLKNNIDIDNRIDIITNEIMPYIKTLGTGDDIINSFMKYFIILLLALASIKYNFDYTE